jgi:starch synthase
MRIVQTVFGVFHHFDLARELERQGHLQQIYTSWPWQRIRREGLAHSKVSTFPWIHVAEYFAGRSSIPLPWLTDELGYANALAFDRWTLARMKRLPELPEALIGISGSSLAAGSWLQSQGGIFICDRGSTHPRYQDALLTAEYRHWGVDQPASDIRDTLREEKIYACADAITVPSNFAQRSFIESGVPPEKVHVIPYGVRLESFSAGTPPPTDRFEVLFAGHVSLRKGVPYLLEAFARVKHPAKRLRLIGGIEPALKGLLNRLPTHNTEFLGVQPRQRLAECMQQSHVLVLPSIEDGFGLVMAEAMASGCPIISSTNTGGPELYRDEKEGFIVPPKDVEALAASLQKLANEPALQRRMRLAALECVQHMGGWAEYGDRWERLLKGLLDDHRTAQLPAMPPPTK